MADEEPPSAAFTRLLPAHSHHHSGGHLPTIYEVEDAAADAVGQEDEVDGGAGDDGGRHNLIRGSDDDVLATCAVDAPPLNWPIVWPVPGTF